MVSRGADRQRSSGCGSTRRSLSVALIPNVKTPAALGAPHRRPRYSSSTDPAGSGARRKSPLVGAASTRRGEGLREADPDFARRRPRRTKRRLDAHGLTDAEGERLRFLGAAADGLNVECEAPLGGGCPAQDAGRRQCDARRKGSRYDRPGRLYIGAVRPVHAHDLLRGERFGVRLADGGRSHGVVFDLQPGVDVDAELAFRSILALAPRRSALCRGQVVIPDPTKSARNPAPWARLDSAHARVDRQSRRKCVVDVSRTRRTGSGGGQR